MAWGTPNLSKKLQAGLENATQMGQNVVNMGQQIQGQISNLPSIAPTATPPPAKAPGFLGGAQDQMQPIGPLPQLGGGAVAPGATTGGLEGDILRRTGDFLSQPNREAQRTRLAQDLSVAQESQRRMLESGVGQGAFGGLGATTAGAAERLQESAFLGERGRALGEFDIAQDENLQKFLPVAADIELAFRSQGNQEALTRYALVKDALAEVMERGDTEGAKFLTEQMNSIAKEAGLDFQLPEYTPGKSILEQSVESTATINNWQQQGQQNGYITLSNGQQIQYTPEIADFLKVAGESINDFLTVSSDENISDKSYGDVGISTTLNGVMSVQKGDGTPIVIGDVLSYADENKVTDQKSARNALAKDQRFYGSMTGPELDYVAAQLYLAIADAQAAKKQQPTTEFPEEPKEKIYMGGGQHGFSVKTLGKWLGF